MCCQLHTHLAAASCADSLVPLPSLSLFCRANTAVAGLIIVMIGNLLLVLLSSQHGNETAPASEPATGKDLA